MPPGAGSAGEGRDGALKLGGRGEEDLVTGKNGNGGGGMRVVRGTQRRERRLFTKTRRYWVKLLVSFLGRISPRSAGEPNGGLSVSKGVSCCTVLQEMSSARFGSRAVALCMCVCVCVFVCVFVCVCVCVFV